MSCEHSTETVEQQHYVRREGSQEIIAEAKTRMCLSCYLTRGFQVAAHLERKGLRVWNGKDTCDVLYSIEYSGEVRRHPPRKTWLAVETCVYRERVSCTGTREQTYDCAGSWIPVEEAVDSCSSNLP